MAGDSLGAQVEFQSAAAIRSAPPHRVRELTGGGPHRIIPGQLTDDSEMALALARVLIDHGAYDADQARAAYVAWINSGPCDYGGTTMRGLQGTLDQASQANGALMRISPLGIFGAGRDPREVAAWARQDAAVTHPHPVCRAASALWSVAIARAVATGCTAGELYNWMLEWAEGPEGHPVLARTIRDAAWAPPPDFMRYQGWVVLAVRNAVWQLLHGRTLEEGVVDTVMRGGDTDTNAAICGALLGAVHGEQAVPDRWRRTLAACRPAAGVEGVAFPRPECFWPAGAMDLPEALLGAAG